MPETEQWQSRIGVILAVAGSAVGLGNFLRFPGEAFRNGGGAFMLPYFAALVLLGIPLCWAEWTMGRYGGACGFHSAPGIFTALWPRRGSKYLALPALLIPLVVFMYYVVIEAWCLAYAFKYVTGELMLGESPQRYTEHFRAFVGSDADGALLAAAGSKFVALLVGCFGLNFLLVYRGISRGIERFCNIAMPLMAALALVVLLRVLTLGTPDPTKPERNVVAGLGFMWNPQTADVLDPRVWLAAAGQIFFSLGVGFGIIINYASYVRRDDDVVLSGLTAASTNELFEVCFGGLITLPAAFVFLGAAVGTTTTFGLGFETLPNVFAAMPGGQACGALWFFMLFLAAVTSSVAMVQPVCAFFEEGLGLGRGAAVAVTALVAGCGCACVVYFSKNQAALDTMDFWVGTVLIVCLALIQALLYGWLFGIERGAREAHRGAELRIPRVVQYVLKYVTPVYLTWMLAAFARDQAPAYFRSLSDDRAAVVTLSLIVVVASVFLLSFDFAGRRRYDLKRPPADRDSYEQRPLTSGDEA